MTEYSPSRTQEHPSDIPQFSKLHMSQTYLKDNKLKSLHLSRKHELYGLLTKCEVKITGYWPSSVFACLWTETQSRSINS